MVLLSKTNVKRSDFKNRPPHLSYWLVGSRSPSPIVSPEPGAGPAPKLNAPSTSLLTIRNGQGQPGLLLPDTRTRH